MHKDGKVEITIISSIALPFCRPVLLCLCLCFVSLLSDPTPGSSVLGTGPPGQSYLGLVYPKIAEPLIQMS
jgi:hypothetical protein